MTRRAIVVLANGFEEIEAVTPIDVLRRAGVGVTVAGLDAREVEGAHGVVYRANTLVSDIIQTPDAIILPGGMPGSANLGRSNELKRIVLDVKSSNGICAAICAAPALTLGKWGILDNIRATCYPSFEKEFPATTIFSEERVVVDGNVVTSRGPGTAFDFALALTELLVDKGTADKLRQGMLLGD